MQPYFKSVVNLSKKWRKELIQYIVNERRIHNARIESAIFMLKMRSRMGRGLSFPMLRAVVLWESGRHRIAGEPSMTARTMIERTEPYFDQESGSSIQRA